MGDGDSNSNNEQYRVYTLTLKPIEPKKKQDLCWMDNLINDVSETDPKAELLKFESHMEFIQNQLGMNAVDAEDSAADATASGGDTHDNKKAINLLKKLKRHAEKHTVESADTKSSTLDPLREYAIEKSMRYKFNTLRMALEKVTAGAGNDTERMSPLPTGTAAARSPNQIPLHKGSNVFIDKETLRRIYVTKPGIYTLRLCDALFHTNTLLQLALALTVDKYIQLGGAKLLAITTHVLEVFKAQGHAITRDVILGFIVHKLQSIQNNAMRDKTGKIAKLEESAMLEKLIEEEGFSFGADNLKLIKKQKKI